jgi:peptidyl-prolyl cis-trans isomerase C
MFLTGISRIQIIVTALVCLAAVLPARGDVKKPATEDKAAIVNGAVITKEELDGEVFLVQRTVLGTGKPLTCSLLAAIQKEVLDSLIRREILFQESRKAGTKVDPKEIDKEIDGLKKKFLSEAEYRNELNRKNISEDKLRVQLERGLSIQRYVDRQFVKKVKIADADVMAYYESHLSLLKQPLQVRVSHILIQSDSKWDASRKQEARRKADQILRELKRGKDFAAVAREQSDGPTRTNGGELGYIKMGQLEKQLEDVVFSLKAGDISDVVETVYGFHLFKVVDRKAESIEAYDNVKDQIRQYLVQEKAKQEANLQAQKMREKSKVEILLEENGSSAKRP